MIDISKVSSTTTGWYPSNSPTGTSILQSSSQTPPLQHLYGPLSHGPSTHNLSLMQSDPNLHCHSPFDAPVNPYTPSGSYTDINMASSPMQTQGSAYNNLLDSMYRPERSKSLGNLHLIAQNARYIYIFKYFLIMISFDREPVSYRRHSAVPFTKRTRFIV